MVISIKQQGWELGKIEFKQKQITRFQVSNVITQKRNKELIQLIFEGNILTIHPQSKDREKKKEKKKTERCTNKSQALSMFFAGRIKNVAILKLFCVYCRTEQKHKYFYLGEGFSIITM